MEGWLLVGAEGGGGEVFAVEEVGGGGVIGPGVADEFWRWDFGVGGDDLVSLYGRGGPAEFFVISGDGDVLEGAIFCDEALAGVVEGEGDFPGFNGG